MERGLKKRLAFGVLLLAAVSCMTGCNLLQNMVENHFTHYEQEDADRIAERGSAMMGTWLEENMPDATLTECSAFVQNIRYSGHEYLTDYAVGRICRDDKELDFSIDTVTGDVYFKNDPGTGESLNRMAAAYLYKTMVIRPQGSEDFFECYVLAPFRDEGHEVKAYQFNYGFDFGLPAGVEDLEAFVRNPASRPLIYVRTRITLSDKADLSAYDFAAFEKLSEECGMLFGSISIENSSQTSKRAVRDWVTEASFYEYGSWIEREGFCLTGRIRVREEERDDLTGEMTASDRRFAPRQDLVFEETQSGYQYYLPNADWADEVFCIRANEDAGIRKHNYIYYFSADVEDVAEGRFDPDTEEGIETIWREQDDGSYVLSSKAKDAPISFSYAGRLERME